MAHLAFRVIRRARREVARAVGRARDRRRGTHAVVDHRTLTRRIGALDVAVLEPRLAELRELAARWLDHRFDLLGSGWVQVRHGMQCAGLEGVVFPPAARTDIDAKNAGESRRLSRLIEESYTPIDWHLDYKSGFRWSERTWYKDIRFGDVRGVDVKVPWELARMQHLGTLALLYGLERQYGEHAAAERLRREFRNEVLDFIAANPPRFGVNWRTAMDVGIRAANWVIAWDIFRAHGAEFDAEFEQALFASVAAHAAHIRSNLEWEPTERGNHYLADIACLAILSVYASADARSAEWLSFSRAELIREIERQFFATGGGVEASTCYHRLSLELALFATAALLGEDDAEFPNFVTQRLRAALRFTADLTRPDGTVPQIGDNDSGRLFKLAPPYDPNLDERHLDHRQVLEAGAALLGAHAAHAFVDAEVITGLSRGRVLRSIDAPIHDQPIGAAAALPAGEPSQTWRFVVDGGSALAGLRHDWYPEFGVLVYRGERVHLVFRCGGLGRGVLLAHAHADQLSVEIAVDGTLIVGDPGTYVYTAFPELRNRYRQTSAHFVPRVGTEEQAELPSVFQFRPRGEGRLIHVGDTTAVAEYDGYSRRVWRRITIEDDAITVCDFGTDAAVIDGPEFSPGYGIRVSR